jgi:hypothetical protein
LSREGRKVLRIKELGLGLGLGNWGSGIGEEIRDWDILFMNFVF